MPLLGVPCSGLWGGTGLQFCAGDGGGVRSPMQSPSIIQASGARSQLPTAKLVKSSEMSSAAEAVKREAQQMQ